MKRSVFPPLLTLLAAALLLLGSALAFHHTTQQCARAAHLRLLHAVLPGSTHFVLEPYHGEDRSIYRVHRGDTGVVIQTVTPGYAAPIRMMVGVSNEGFVTGLVVETMSETAGLGSKALTDHAFLAQLLNTSGNAEVGKNIDALSGATVTSKAIVRSVNSAVAVVTGADIGSGATPWGGQP